MAFAVGAHSLVRAGRVAAGNERGREAVLRLGIMLRQGGLPDARPDGIHAQGLPDGLDVREIGRHDDLSLLGFVERDAG